MIICGEKLFLEKKPRFYSLKDDSSVDLCQFYFLFAILSSICILLWDFSFKASILTNNKNSSIFRKTIISIF